MRKNILLLSLLALITSPALTHAAIFDAGDFLATNSTSVGGFGEIILNDPTSEGVEGRIRHGFSDEWNGAAIIGTGSKNKGFRLGGEAVYNFFPDADGQFGVSAIGSLIYLKRNTGGILTRIAPLVHKKLGVGGYETTLYVSVPFNFETRSGTYTSSTQAVVGALFDIASGSRTYLASEFGINMAKSESYLLLGVGFRFGELKWGGSNSSERSERKAPRRAKQNKEEDEKEFRTEDFDQPIK